MIVGIFVAPDIVFSCADTVIVTIHEMLRMIHQIYHIDIFFISYRD